MKILTYIAKIDGKEVKITSAEIKKSWQTLIDTAEVELYDKVEEGVFIEIFGGYNRLDKIFEGYVIDSIKQDIGYKLKCEDKNTLLKNETITKYFAGGSLKDFLSAVEIDGKPNIKATLRAFRFSNATKSEILNELKKQGIFSFLRDNQLIVGLPYLEKQNEIEFYAYGEKNEIISTNFQDSSVDMKNIVLEGVNIKNDVRKSYFCYFKNNEIFFSAKKPDKGQIKTLYFYDLSEAEIKERLSEYLKTKINTGLTGDFFTFVHKIVKPEDIVILHLEDRDAKVYVKAVDYIFSFNGGRQKIYIDYEIPNQ